MAVQLSEIIMSYPGTLALNQVSAEFRFDEVHGLIGENGAGKTTLVSILGGSRSPTSGTIRIDGSEVRLLSAGDALRKGIAHVSQEGSLVPGLSGAQNILLGDEPRMGLGIINKSKLSARAAELLQRWFPQVKIDLDQPVDLLPMADQKIIEIVRALRGNVRLLILDEPTATLPAREKESLWAIIKTLPQQGVGIVLISHFLSEIKALSDRITVLRDGRHVATLQADATSEADLVDLMLQRSNGGAAVAADQQRAMPTAESAEILSVKDWHVGGVQVERFSLRAGEIVGLIGLTGAGHFGFARSLYAAAGATNGDYRFEGKTVSRVDARSMQKKGVALIPDHRMEYSLIGEWDVRENLAMVHPSHAAMAGLGVLSMRKEAREADRVMKLLNVKAHSRSQFVRDLSGGNKQKVSIGKWLYGADDHYRLMIFIEPTEGVDIGAKREIHSQMRRLAETGIAIIVASSDLLEVAEVADRVVPFVNGRPGADIARNAFSEARFIAAMAGDIQ